MTIGSLLKQESRRNDCREQLSNQSLYKPYAVHCVSLDSPSSPHIYFIAGEIQRYSLYNNILVAPHYKCQRAFENFLSKRTKTSLPYFSLFCIYGTIRSKRLIIRDVNNNFHHFVLVAVTFYSLQVKPTDVLTTKNSTKINHHFHRVQLYYVGLFEPFLNQEWQHFFP